MTNVIMNKEHTEYNIRYSNREMEVWRNFIAKEENKSKPNEKMLTSFQKFYDKYWNMNIEAKLYLGLI